jgi:hypothetical protein
MNAGSDWPSSRALATRHAAVKQPSDDFIVGSDRSTAIYAVIGLD